MKEFVEVGYIYNNKRRIKKPIMSRRIMKKGCTKFFKVGDQKPHPLAGCNPVMVGFDLALNVKLGATLYAIINIYARFELVAPLRIMVPELRPGVCGKATNSLREICASGPHLRASF